jgi:hypothetical protein
MSNLLEIIEKNSSNYFDETNDLQVTVQGRRFPIEERSEPITEIPPQFHSIPLEIFRGLPFTTAPNGGTDVKYQWYEVYHKSMDAIGRMYEELGIFLESIFVTNVEARTDWMANRRKQELMREKAKEWQAWIPKLNLTKPAVIRLDLDKSANFIIRQTLEQSLHEACEQLILRAVEALDFMVGMEMVGLLQWHGDRACKYHHFRHVVIEHKADQRLLTHTTDGPTLQTVRRRIETDVEHTHRRARHIHELVDAKNHALPTSVPMPARVRTLAEGIPTWLRSLGRVVTGTEVFRRIIERDVRVEKKTEVEEHTEVFYKPDPALCLGFYVLTGWNDDEVEKEQNNV